MQELVTSLKFTFGQIFISPLIIRISSTTGTRTCAWTVCQMTQARHCEVEGSLSLVGGVVAEAIATIPKVRALKSVSQRYVPNSVISYYITMSSHLR